MTPSDIATSIGGLKPTGDGNIATSRLPTYCFSGGNYIADDQNDWD